MAGIKLHLATAKIWRYFFENIERLQDNEDCIAEDTEAGWSLYLTANTIFPEFVVYAGDKAIFFKLVRSEEECSKWAVYLITRLTEDTKKSEKKEAVKEDSKIIEFPAKKLEQKSEVIEVPEDEDDEEYQQMIDTVYEREDDLTNAMADLLAVVLLEDDCNAVFEGYGKQMVYECVDDFLQYLHDQHSVSVYRPTVEVDEETGCEILKEFPYGWDDCDDVGEEYDEVN